MAKVVKMKSGKHAQPERMREVVKRGKKLTGKKLKRYLLKHEKQAADRAQRRVGKRAAYRAEQQAKEEVARLEVAGLVSTEAA